MFNAGRLAISRRTVSSAAVLVLAAVIVTPGSPIQARGNDRAAHAFHGTFHGMSPGAPVAGSVYALVTGGGFATVLGKSTLFAHLTVFQANVRWTGCTQVMGTQSLTSTAGGRIDLIFVAPSCQKSASVASGTGHYLVVGGTGRFRGAGGSGTSTATVVGSNPAEPKMITVTYSGTLTLPR